MKSGLTSATEATIGLFALTFDGYAYTEKMWQHRPERAAELREQLHTSGRLSAYAEENFAVNFLMHRDFYSWKHLPENLSPVWYQMLWLYLHLYRTPVPTAFRHADLYQQWQQRPKGAAEAAAAEIRMILSRHH
ncbi:hypothetical protein E5K00_14765 [Hymenobacter aquaticus]|uniref:Uncharacterized protein n=1 Tax=Hymenobacter aquaticus TaxID=1867101 RepID=A0A4Z0PXC1_9BACT|nr:hypothetical protein [Hymenobacter aquaticus]TGE21543.1 hypothetical protein E5K00_14765 [Hymenobacter aquaticus]